MDAMPDTVPRDAIIVERRSEVEPSSTPSTPASTPSEQRVRKDFEMERGDLQVEASHMRRSASRNVTAGLALLAAK